MSDDLFDTLGAEAVFEEEEEQPEPDAGEKQNKTFLIAVAIMGGLLVCALIAFGVWALVINPQMKRAAQQASEGVTIEAPTAETELVATPTVEEAQPAEEKTVPPTNTPKPTPTPTPTPVIGPTATPESGEAAAGAGGDATPTPTPRVRRTDTPTPTTAAPAGTTPRPTAGTSGTTERTPDTGFGEIALVAAAVLLVGVFFTARRLRKA
jgi:cytoskeletal protein RodZ